MSTVLVVNFPNIEITTLGKLTKGEVFSFADSGNTPAQLFETLVNPCGNIFMVFADEGNKNGGEDVDVVSLDGKQMLRRYFSREVMRIKGCDLTVGVKSPNRAMVSNLEPGTFVCCGYGQVSMVVKGNPSPKGKVLLINRGFGIKRVEVDDDLLVHFYPDARFCVNLDFA